MLVAPFPLHLKKQSSTHTPIYSSYIDIHIVTDSEDQLI